MVVWGSRCWSNACEQLLSRTQSSGLFAIGFLALAGGLLFAGCRNAPNLSNDSVNSDVVTSTPPFATKEPDRYQANRTITFTEAVTATPVNETRTTSVLIMRDGEERREEHEGGSVGAIVYLELASGHFVLLPREKLYADLSWEASDDGMTSPQFELAEVSPDLLLNESVPSSRYEKLGAETVAGRPTTKYRVTSKAGAFETVKSETLIWIDEALGMPIKSESTYADSNRTTKLLMELKDIRTEVNPESFSLPGDYRKVAANMILEKIRHAANQTVPTPSKE